jgi:hypothetical protein
MGYVIKEMIRSHFITIIISSSSSSSSSSIFLNLKLISTQYIWVKFIPVWNTVNLKHFHQYAIQSCVVSVGPM